MPRRDCPAPPRDLRRAFLLHNAAAPRHWKSHSSCCLSDPMLVAHIELVETDLRVRLHAMLDCRIVSPQALCAILRAVWEQSVC